MSWVAANGVHRTATAAAAFYCSRLSGVSVSSSISYRATTVAVFDVQFAQLAGGAGTSAGVSTGSLRGSCLGVRFSSTQTPTVKKRAIRTRSMGSIEVAGSATTTPKKRVNAKAAAADASTDTTDTTAKAAATEPRKSGKARNMGKEKAEVAPSKTTRKKKNDGEDGGAEPPAKATASTAKRTRTSSTAKSKTMGTAAEEERKSVASSATIPSAKKTATTLTAAEKRKAGLATAVATAAVAVTTEAGKKMPASASQESTARFVVTPEATITSSPPSPPSPMTPLSQSSQRAPTSSISLVDNRNAAAIQEAALAELKRLRLAATPAKLSASPAVAEVAAESTATSSAAAVAGPGSLPEITPNLEDTPKYKEASRKWTSLIVAIPILLVTSYFLFDRLVMGNVPKDLSAYRQKVSDSVDQLQGAVGMGIGSSKNDSNKSDSKGSNHTHNLE